MDLIISAQKDVGADPYNIPLRTQLMFKYEEAGYHDLAAGEAYRAILLYDELADDSGEFHEEAIIIARRVVENIIRERPSKASPEEALLGLSVDSLDDQAVINYARQTWLKPL